MMKKLIPMLMAFVFYTAFVFAQDSSIVKKGQHVKNKEWKKDSANGKNREWNDERKGKKADWKKDSTNSNKREWKSEAKGKNREWKKDTVNNRNRERDDEDKIKAKDEDEKDKIKEADNDDRPRADTLRKREPSRKTKKTRMKTTNPSGI
jgi:hypothetical protein